MRHIFKIVGCLPILLATALHAQTVQERKPVAPTGETVIVANSPKFSVRVKIVTHEVDIGKPSDGRPKVIRSRCTYSRYPCSIVDRLNITVNGKSVHVPCSVLCSVTADLNTAEVKIEQNKSILILTGGDASESYIVKIEFNGEMVTHSVVFSGEAPDEPLAEITYHQVIFE
jgi:uncharacterized Fe-S center protein